MFQESVTCCFWIKRIQSHRSIVFKSLNNTKAHLQPNYRRHKQHFKWLFRKQKMNTLACFASCSEALDDTSLEQSSSELGACLAHGWVTAQIYSNLCFDQRGGNEEKCWNMQTRGIKQGLGVHLWRKRIEVSSPKINIINTFEGILMWVGHVFMSVGAHRHSFIGDKESLGCCSCCCICYCCCWLKLL